jgi:hypothetical protein
MHGKIIESFENIFEFYDIVGGGSQSWSSSAALGNIRLFDQGLLLLLPPPPPPPPHKAASSRRRQSYRRQSRRNNNLPAVHISATVRFMHAVGSAVKADRQAVEYICLSVPWDDKNEPIQLLQPPAAALAALEEHVPTNERTWVGYVVLGCHMHGSTEMVK